jgi:hypothetical protein
LSIDSAIIGDQQQGDSFGSGNESPIDPFRPRLLQVPASQTTTIVGSASMTADSSNLASRTIPNSSRRTLRRRKSVECLSESSSSRPSTVATAIHHGNVNASARTSARTSTRSGEDSPIDPFYLDNLHVHRRSLSPRTLEVPRVLGEGRSPVSSRQSFDMSYYLDDAGDTPIRPAIPSPSLPPRDVDDGGKEEATEGGYSSLYAHLQDHDPFKKVARLFDERVKKYPSSEFARRSPGQLSTEGDQTGGTSSAHPDIEYIAEYPEEAPEEEGLSLVDTNETGVSEMERAIYNRAASSERRRLYQNKVGPLISRRIN